VIQEASQNEKLKSICIAMVEAAKLRHADVVSASANENNKRAARDALKNSRASLEILTEWYCPEADQ